MLGCCVTIITRSGKAENIEVVSGDFRDEALESCVKQVIASWRFPTPDEAVYVAHRFFFGKPPKFEPPQMVNTK